MHTRITYLYGTIRLLIEQPALPPEVEADGQTGQQEAEQLAYEPVTAYHKEPVADADKYEHPGAEIIHIPLQ